MSARLAAGRSVWLRPRVTAVRLLHTTETLPKGTGQSIGAGVCALPGGPAVTTEAEEVALADLYRVRFHFRLRRGQAGTQDDDPAGDVRPQQQDHDAAEGVIDRVHPAEVGQVDCE